MGDDNNVEQLIVNSCLMSVQILLEIYSYIKYKQQNPLEKHSYKKYLNKCFKESIFNENFQDIRKQHKIYQFNHQNINRSDNDRKQQLQPANIFLMKNNNRQESIDEVEESNLQSSSSHLYTQKNSQYTILPLSQDENQQLLTDRLPAKSFNSYSRKQFNEANNFNVKQKKEIKEGGKMYFYFFYSAILLSLPISIIKYLCIIYFNSDSNKIAIEFVQRLLVDIENTFNYLCFIFIGLMMQSQGIFIKLISDQYLKGINQIHILIKCQFRRSALLAFQIYILQQILNIYLILSAKDKAIYFPFQYLFYIVIFASFIYKGQDYYSNEKIQKDQILSQYYNQFYEKYFNYNDLLKEYRVNIQKGNEYNNEDFKEFLESKMYISLSELKIKETQLEQNHQFKDLVFNQGALQQIKIKILYLYLAIFIPIYLLSLLIKFTIYSKFFVYNDIKYVTNISEIIQIGLGQSSQANDLSNNHSYTLAQLVYSSMCYTLFIFLKYFTKQSIFFNATAYATAN